MKVKRKILDLIDKPIVRTRIAGKLNCGEQAVAFQIRHNRDNGRLTKLDFLQAIADETDLPISDLVEEETIGETG